MKLQALEYARRIRDDRGSGNLIVVNQNEETSDMTEEELEVGDLDCLQELCKYSLLLWLFG